MIEISISSELAADHPEFMAGCAERGQQVQVFENARSGERAAPRASFAPPAARAGSQAPVQSSPAP